MKFWSGFLLGGGELEPAGVGEGQQSQGSGLSSCLGWIPVASNPLSDSTRAVFTLEAFICVQGPLTATLSVAVCGLGRDSPEKPSLRDGCVGVQNAVAVPTSGKLQDLPWYFKTF